MPPYLTLFLSVRLKKSSSVRSFLRVVYLVNATPHTIQTDFQARVYVYLGKMELSVKTVIDITPIISEVMALCLVFPFILQCIYNNISPNGFKHISRVTKMLYLIWLEVAHKDGNWYSVYSLDVMIL